MKFYSVKNGRVIGIYTNWEECKVQINGYKGAIYKSFSTENEAREFIGLSKTSLIEDIKEEDNLIYVDGGYGNYSSPYGYGSVVDRFEVDIIPKYLFDNFTYKEVDLPIGKRHVILAKFDDVQTQQNNSAELFAMIFGLQVALTEPKYKIIYCDSTLIINYWSLGRFNKTNLSSEKIKWIEHLTNLRKEFEKIGGQIIKIGGGENLADLGYHR